MPIRLTLVAFLAATALALAACSAPATTTPGEAPPGPSRGTAGPTTAPSASTAPSNLLTPADVEQVSSLTGIKAVPRDPTKGAGGQVNLATADGKLVVMANFGNGAQFDTMKSSPNYRESLSGLGDAAFIGPSKNIMPTLYIVGFKKGDHSAVLNTFFKGATTDTMLTMDQLKALAAIVASRW
jgi:hypothetical protein